MASLTSSIDIQQPMLESSSLHRLSIDNPWFAVHPLFWAPQHLRLLHCRFQHLDSAAPAAFASPSQPPYDDPELALHSRKLSKNRSSVVKSLSVGHLLGRRGSPLEKVTGSPCFLYARRRVHLPNCQVFQTIAADHVQQRPIVGYYHYNNLILERKQALTPRLHPVTGRCNSPVLRIYQRRLRDVNPALWFEDPYLVCVLLALAQLQWQRRQSPQPETFNARLLIRNKSDTTNAHVFQADIPHLLLQALDHPTLDQDQVLWPTIQHIRVPFEPYSSFAQRITAQLVGDKHKLPAVKPRVTAMEQGAKRKRDGLDAVRPRKSIKIQPATMSTANG
ncbi:hypothetical protein FDENT_11399 [Fusarium denticulatum]|uniref:Uncharacterized protein n=1 Tax=Fusarium denticulatum TaxID=48507 RepID=A0A8H5WRV0_9HYPO|nr:hypothetical protein FDENT_11399 [Fusarium denticulatum]